MKTKAVRLFISAGILLTGIFGSSVSAVEVRAHSEFTPTFVETSCQIDLPIGEVEGKTFVCGYVDVPEFHADPTGKTIRLSVAIIKGRGAEKDPLVMFTGGPGGNVFNLAPPMSSSMGTPVWDYRDIVLMSERGSIGAAPELTCPELGEALRWHFAALL